MADFSTIDSAHIVRVLAKVGHTHRCARCETRMLVKQESNLCVYCFNDLRTSLSEATAGELEHVEGPIRPRLHVAESPIEDDDDEAEAPPMLAAPPGR
jgi:hypothetical protein